MFKKTALALMASGLILAISTIAVYGQTSEVKEKPRMYTSVADWVIPRSQWADMDKVIASTRADFEKAFADGTLVGYGDDTTLVHHEDGNTNDTWWSSMSLAGFIKVLEQVRKSANPTAPPLTTAMKHWDNRENLQATLSKAFKSFASLVRRQMLSMQRSFGVPCTNPARMSNVEGV